MATRLTKLRIDEVSLCEKGANPGAMITLFKRDAPTEIEVPRDSDRYFGATGRGEAHTALWASYDNHRRALGPGRQATAFAQAWADLDDAGKQAIRDEEASTEAAKEAAAAAAEAERKKEMMKTMNNSKLEEIVKLAHQIQDGTIGNHADRASWYGAIKALAEEHREPGETAQMAFARVITKTADGKAMFAAYQGSAGTDYRPEPEAPTAILKADSAYMKLKKIAADLNADDPDLTDGTAFVKAFNENRELAELSKRESAFA